MKNGLVALVILVLASANVAASDAPTAEGHLWLAGMDGARRVNVMNGETSALVSPGAAIDAIATHPRTGDAWLLSNNVLYHYGADGELFSASELPVDGSMLANMLELDPERNVVWVADPLNVFRFDMQGGLQQRWPVNGTMFWSADLAADGRLWLAAHDGAWFVEAGSDLTAAFSDPSLAASVVVADAVRDGIWLVGAHGAALYSETGQQRALVPVQTLLAPVHAATDGNGGLWVAGGEVAAYINTNDEANVVVMPFSDITLPNGYPAYISELIADDASGGVWLATQGHVRRIIADGTRTVDIAVPAAGNIFALAQYRDRIAPEIRFDFPEDHTTSNDPRTPLGVSWSDAGDGADAETLRLNLDGVALQTICETNESASICQPAADIPQGTHYLTATVADFAGNISAPAALNLTIESEGPRIDALEPTHGPAGTRVTLIGGGFDTLSLDGNRVTFNGASAIISRVTATQLDVIVPLSASTGAVRVENANGAHTATTPFTVTLRENFDIGVSEQTVQLPQQGYAHTVLTLASLGLIDYAQLVNLQFEGLPEGVTVSLDHGRLAANQPVTLTFTGEAPPGEYIVRVRATGLVDGKLVTREIEITLVILAPGVTTLGGRVLHADDDRPFVDALVQLGDEVLETDSTGSYLFVDPPLTGDQVILIDGHTNNTAEVHYASRIVMPVSIVPAQANRSLTSYLSAVDTSSFTNIVPGQAASVTNPELPDYELRIPQGAVLTGWDGEPIDKISVRVIPPDRLPIRPIPEGVTTNSVYLYYFFRPGGAEPSEPIPVTMRNDLGMLPGEKVNLWYYDETPNPDPESNQWRIMGQGTVSDDGLSIVSDPGVGIPRFCCGASFPSPPAPPPSPPGGDGGGPCGGNPVDLPSGIGSVLDDHTLSINGLFPASIECRYSSNTERDGPFGTGTWMNYEWRLLGGGASYTVVTPRGTRYTLVRDADGVYRSRGGRAGAQGMEVTRGNGIARLRMKRGKVMEFSLTDPFSTQLMAVEDSHGNRITLTREASTTTSNGRLLIVSDSNGRRWRLDYESARRVGSITDPLGRVQHFGYDSAGRLNSVTDFEGNVTEYTWNDDSRIIAKRNADGVTHYEYDVEGRTIKETLANNGEVHFAYDLVGETVTGTTVTNPRGYQRRYRFNSLGYNTRRIDALGRVFEKQYDPVTNKLRRKTDPLGRKTFYTYDTRGNRTSVRNPADHVTVRDYHPVHNKPTRIQDALGRETHLTYDIDGNLKTTTNALDQTTQFEYDERGLVTAITNALENATHFNYDGDGNLIAAVDPLGNTWRYEYDLANRKTTATDPLGRTTRYEYDNLDRLTRVIDARGGTTEIAYTARGRIETVTDAKSAVIETNTYDSMGNIKTRADSQGRTHHYAYDLNNNLIRHTDPKSQITEFAYDELDR
ncbi:MAG TPA: DUF6531 domain-containing protein, partial [Gammaproteobacteria bacterium]